LISERQWCEHAEKKMLDYRIRAVKPELPETTEWLKYLSPALEANWFTNFGPVNAQFEARLFALYGCAGEEVVTSVNATAGLSACLIAENISGPVLCPAFTFQATAAAILSANCKPVIIDVHPSSGVVEPEVLEASLRITGARAALVIAPYGIKTDFRQHAEICQTHNCLLVIDNAAGLGIARQDTFAAESRDVVREVYSLHATKPFGIGEGCAIFAPKVKAPALRAAMNFGLQTHTATGTQQGPYWGINGKMSEFQAAIGLAVGDTMAARVAGRQKMARAWMDAFADAPVMPFCNRPQDASWQVFPVLTRSEDHLLAIMDLANQQGIELRRYYAPSLGACSGMQNLGACPNAQSLAERALVFPIRSNMPEDAQAELISTLRQAVISAAIRETGI
jgi:dTDP-4-amino-4,6-dideoxygalactose transaminase